MRSRQQIIKALGEKDEESISIPKHMFIEWDSSAYGDHLEITNKIIKTGIYGLRKKTPGYLGNNGNNLTIGNKTHTFNLFSALKKLLKKGMYMRLNGNELVLFNSVNKTFTFDLSKCPN